MAAFKFLDKLYGF